MVKIETGGIVVLNDVADDEIDLHRSSGVSGRMAWPWTVLRKRSSLLQDW